MDHSAEIDEAIGRLASAEYPAAVEALLAFGEPALHRLLQVSDGSVRPAFGDQYPARDTADNLVFALRVVGERHLDAFLLAVRQGQRLSQVSVVWALGQLDDPRVVEPLLVALTGSDRFARWAAAERLGERGDERAIEPLICALRDRHPSVRFAAVDALAKIGDERAVGPLERVISARSNVRYAGGVEHARAALDRIRARHQRGSTPREA